MKQYAILILILISAWSARAQVGIGNVVPDSSAILDLRNTNNRALLLPEIPGTPPSSPAGLVYWDNALDQLMYLESNGYNALSPWRYKFNGSTSNNIYYSGSGFLGLGMTDPQRKFHLKQNGEAMAFEGTATVYMGFYPESFSAGSIARIGFISNASTFVIQNQKSGTSGDVEIALNGGQLNVTGTNAKLQENGNDLIPRGVIVMWSGDQNEIPDGWGLCDGNAYNKVGTTGTITTPDLSGRFIVGYDANETDYNEPGNRSLGLSQAGKIGGDKTVTLSVAQMPSHTHTFTGTGTAASAGNHRHNIATACGSCSGTGAHNTSSGVAIDGNNDSSPDYNVKTTHVESTGAHTHSVSVGGTTATSGSTAAHENRPPYYVLAFIMKL
jgi:microcystin-dependent protein